MGSDSFLFAINRKSRFGLGSFSTGFKNLNYFIISLL
jgi:hypothetical protein